MLGALLYLQVHSIRNRLFVRLRRLRRPRYLFGALVGGLYLFFVFARPLIYQTRHVGPRAHSAFFPVIDVQVWEFLAALALSILAVLTWVVPQQRAALVFSEAEIAFLFPAPVRRRTLIHFKLVRSQAAILFTVFVLTLVTRWSSGVGAWLLRAMGWWMLLSTMQLHQLGASFARTLLVERGLTPWRRRAAVLSLVALLVAVAVWWGRGNLPSLTEADLRNAETVTAYLGKVAHSPPAVWLLWPFRAVTRPFLESASPRAFLAALGPALGLLALHYAWVVRSDLAFEEASLAASERHASRVAAVRSGQWQNVRPARRRRSPFVLTPTGSPAVAIFWKNLLGAGQFFNVRIALAVLLWSAMVGVGIGTGGPSAAWPVLLGSMCLLLLGWCVILGPQFVRQDFRRDLAVADLLKSWPIRGWQVALGELLAPAAILTAIEWPLLVLSTALLAGVATAGEARHAGHWPALAASVPAGLSAAALIPSFNLISLLIPNAAALLFPAWFASGSGQLGGVGGASARGIEMIGQRLLFLMAQLLVTLLALVPAALAAFLAYSLVADPLVGDPWALPISAVVASVTLLAEAAFGVATLGYWFETYDLTVDHVL